MKDACWRYESEYRIVVKFLENPRRDRITLKFSISDKERGISILSRPELDEREFEEITNEFMEYGIKNIHRFEKVKINMNVIEKNRRILKHTT